MKMKDFFLSALVAALACAFFSDAGSGPACALGGPKPQGEAQMEVVLELPWGSGGAMLGRVDGNESASYGPMSFALSSAGDLYILDQVNLRILKIYADGSAGGEIGLPAPGCEDIAVAADGSIVLLSRTAGKALFVLDPATGHSRSVPIEGPGIPEGGLVTAMAVEDDGVWLEVLHEVMVRVLDAALAPGDRLVLPGRKYAGTGTTLGALWKPPRGARLWLQDATTGAVSAGRDFGFAHDIERIAWWDRDAAGSVYAAFHLMQFGDQPPYALRHEEIVGVRLDRALGETGSFSSPYGATDWMQFREFLVDRGGDVYRMAFSDAGVKVLRWRWK
jgi:hypothetical protein